MTPPATFAYLASLFRPVDERVVVRVVTLPDDWSLPDEVGLPAEVAIVGRMPVRGRPTIRTLRHAWRREMTLARLRLRSPAGHRVVSVERLPPVHRPGPLRRLIRSVTMSGLLVELARDPIRPRVIDAICAAAGGRRSPRLRPSGDGSAVATLELAGRDPVQLRVVPLGHPDDPARGRAALIALEAAAVPCVPRPVGHGTINGAAWTTETFVAGRHIQRLTAPLLHDVIATCARFPAGTADVDALAEHAATLVRMRPDDAAVIERIQDAARRWAGPTRVLLHGDLWLHNILAVDGRLAGIIDWEMWHPSGLPGLDVLSLLAAEKRTVSGQDTGDLLVGDYWRSPQVRDALGRYFEARGESSPSQERLAAIAVGWWLSRMAFADGRIDQPAKDQGWARRNIEAPLRVIARLVDDLG